MKIKNILLGTAATLLATASCAYATEAAHKTRRHVVVKPVTKKTVVVVNNACSIFGPGLINIPGTNTCIKIYGQISGTVFGGSTLSATEIGVMKDQKEDEKHTGLNSEARIGLESYVPSSMGPIHARIEARGNLRNGLGYLSYGAHFPNGSPVVYGQNAHLNIHYAYAELGALRLGVDESIFNYWTNNFGGVENDSILNPAAHTPLNAISYRFSNHKGMSAIIGLESSDRAISSLNEFNDYYHSIHNSNKPEAASLIAGVKFEQNWGDVIGVAAYDSYFKKSSAKIRIDRNINNRLNVFGLAAVKTIKDTFSYDDATMGKFSRYSNWSPYGDWDGKWEAMIGGAYVVNPNVTFNAQAGYTEAKTAAASANFVYEVAKNFTVTPELSYISWNDDKTLNFYKHIVAESNLKGRHEVQAMLKICYKF